MQAQIGTHPIDPVALNRGFIEIGGVTQVAYTDASGLTMTSQREAVGEGGNTSFEHSMIGGETYEPLVIKRPFLAKDSELLRWMHDIHDVGKPIERKTVDVVVLDDDGSELGRYSLFGAWICEYEAPSFDASSKDIGFESIKISYDYYTYTQGKPPQEPKPPSGGGQAEGDQSSVWDRPPMERGKAIESQMGANLPPNYPAIDNFEDGAATNITSVDLNAKTYQDQSALSRTVKAQIDAVADFEGRSYGGATVLGDDITSRKLELVVPNEGTPEQQATMADLAAYGASRGVDVETVILH